MNLDPKMMLQTWRSFYTVKRQLDAALVQFAPAFLKTSQAMMENIRDWANGSKPMPELAQRQQLSQMCEKLGTTIRQLQVQLDELTPQIARIDEIMLSLPGNHRQLLEMVYRDGKPLHEAARILEMRPAQAHNLHHQALNLLKAFA